MYDGREDTAFDTLHIAPVRLHMAAAIVLAHAMLIELVRDHSDRVFGVDTFRRDEHQTRVSANFIVRIMNGSGLDAKLLEAADVHMAIEIFTAVCIFVRNSLVTFKYVCHDRPLFVSW